MTLLPRQTAPSRMSPLRYVAMSVALALALSWPALARAEEGTQTSSEGQGDQTAPALENDQIIVKYLPPSKQILKPVYERYKRLQVLEHLKEFLSPLRLPEGVPLRITAKECDETNSWWAGREKGLILCYEWANWVERLAPLDKTPEGYTRDDVIMGGFLQVTFHELGHAMFDIYEIPIFGKEEDAADQMAGFILSQFGKEVARRTLPGTAYVWKKVYEQDGAWPRSVYSDTHGHDLQRSYNYLCMAYGSDPADFQDFVDLGLLPKKRADDCPREYARLLNAFQKTMLPHIDPDKMKLVVEKKDWLPSSIGQ